MPPLAAGLRCKDTTQADIVAVLGNPVCALPQFAHISAAMVPNPGTPKARTRIDAPFEEVADSRTERA